MFGDVQNLSNPLLEKIGSSFGNGFNYMLVCIHGLCVDGILKLRLINSVPCNCVYKNRESFHL